MSFMYGQSINGGQGLPNGSTWHTQNVQNGSFTLKEQNGGSVPTAYTTKLDTAVDADFLEVLKAGVKLGTPIPEILDIHSPIGLGPLVASPMGALAGAILASAGKLATNPTAPAKAFGQGLVYDGIVERAILGEAAFNVVLAMKRPRLQELGVLDEMAKVVAHVAPTTRKIAPFVMHTLTAVSLRVALDALHNHDAAFAPRANGGFVPTNSSATSQAALDAAGEEFVARLRAQVGKTGPFNPEVESVIRTGFREAGPVLTSVAGSGLELLATALPPSASAGKKGDVAHAPYIEGLPERAMLGEAALQALMKVPSRGLDESVFAIMAGSIAKIEHVVRRSAPGLMEDIAFLVKAIVVAPAARAAGVKAVVQQVGFQQSGFQEGDVASATRRMKGFSVNLETELLDHCRGLETKAVPAM